MRVRRLSPILLVVALAAGALAACSSPKAVPEMRTDTLPTQLPPAELPTYAKGDRYTYDNPREDWTIVGLHDGLVSWESSLGETRTTMFDPLLPPIGWKKADESEGTRQILEWSGGMFPLKAGNKITFKTAVQVKGESGHALFIWNCYAGNPRMIEVPAGAFAAVPVYCRRSDGNKLHTFYAPALNNAVSLVLATPGRQGDHPQPDRLPARKRAAGRRAARRILARRLVRGGDRHMVADRGRAAPGTAGKRGDGEPAGRPRHADRPVAQRGRSPRPDGSRKQGKR